MMVMITLTALSGQGDRCLYTIGSRVFDADTKLPIPFVNISLVEANKGGITDAEGRVQIKGLCHDTYKLSVSHINYCDAIEYLHIEEDTVLTFFLTAESNRIDQVVVTTSTEAAATQSKSTVKLQAIEDNIDGNLSDLLESQSGVTSLKNGGGISKPVVQGLFGNRLPILNNGIVQSGQQWGNDHSPEIDPLIANNISVIKGVSALEYVGGSLGSIILVSPQKIGLDQHLHGRVGYSFFSNGRGHSANVQLKQYSPDLSWKLTSTFKQSGDRHTPDYYLTNTGASEANAALQLEKSWDEKLYVDFYLSTFNTTLGVLRGSHIGNLTDLQTALSSDVPFFTEDDFSYQVNAPKQQVGHHLARLNGKYYLSDTEHLTLTLSGQLNDRKEFDIRRGGRTKIPSLDLTQYTFTGDVRYSRKIGSDILVKAGTQSIFRDNSNDAETGILPLIPDYLTWQTGVFTTIARMLGKYTVSAGLRADYEFQSVKAIRKMPQQTVVPYNNTFITYAAASGVKYDISSTSQLRFNYGLSMRSPGINELYSGGLHQGVSGIEEGDTDLQIERAHKVSLDYTHHKSDVLQFSALAYYQMINDYIYLSPQDKVRLTIRGAFPVFKYEQTNAAIYGLDLSAKYWLTDNLQANVIYSYIKGDDVTDNIPLVNIPGNRIQTEIAYQPCHGQESSKWKDLELSVTSRFVFRQDNLLESQDFVLPPASYSLFGVKVSTTTKVLGLRARLYARIDNLFNVKYRDYLNRQRYFADDLGRNVSVGTFVNF